MDHTQQPPPLPDNDPYNRYQRMPPPPPPPQGFAWGQNVLQSCLVAGCVTVFVPVLLVIGFFLMLGIVLSSGLDEKTGSFVQFAQTSGRTVLRTAVLRPGDAENSIAVVNIHGAIDGNGSPLEGDGMLAFVSEQLRSAAEDDSVRAVILHIDSPGGGLTASDQLHHEVERLRKKGKPVIAWAGALMASGGYYIAVAAEEIMANPTSSVGSIGVIMQHFVVKELLDKIGVDVDPVTSGKHKDIGSPFRDMTPEERGIFEAFIGAAHDRFVSIVAKGRNMPEDEVRKFATGDIFNAARAKELGLVDSIGYIEDAVAWAEEKTDAKNMRVIGYRRLLPFSDIFSEIGSGMASALLETVGGANDAPRAMAVHPGK